MVADASQLKITPNWPTVRREYEQTRIALRPLAAKYGIPYSTMSKRCMREHWSQKAKLAAKIVRDAESDAVAALRLEVRTELEPWIAEQKSIIIKRGVNISSRALDRLEHIYQTTAPECTKVESEAARTLETLVRVGRTSLGMSDGNASPGALSVNILTNQAAVQVVRTEDQNLARQTDSQG